MKRLLDSNWKRLGLQVGLLAGVGLAFAIGSTTQPATAGGNPDCPVENECSFKKPNVMFVMDYSTSMNTVWDMNNNATRWQVTVAAVQQIVQPGSFLSQNTHLALMRYGHDPAPNTDGTTINGDLSGITDGHKIDVFWDDDQGAYHDCNGQALVDFLDAVDAPMQGMQFGIGTWTEGALQAVQAEIAATKADHPDDQVAPARAYVNVLLTDGEWTGPDGTVTLQNGYEPYDEAAAMFDDENIRTFVVAVAGDANAEAAADQIAAAGGTTEAIDGDTPELLAMALGDVVQTIIETVVEPECVGGLPRAMILLDASSSMLNINGGQDYGGMGETGWDLARDALAGDMGLFDIDVGIGAAEDVTHLGLAVFGHNQPAPGEQKILVNYGPCSKDNFAWALDPYSAACTPQDPPVACDDDNPCAMGDCLHGYCSDCNFDPWGGPPIVWDFKDGSGDPWGFDNQTNNHMPQCSGNAAFCSGSGTYTHLGLQLVKDNQAQYHADAMQPMALYPTNDQTLYFNILITDGQYNLYSTDAQVMAELQEMYNAGITTYVIGFGDGVDTPAAITQLSNMADWGSGGNVDYYDANNQDELANALAAIFGALEFDQCCAFNDCSENPEPTTNEPDPLPSNMDTGDGDGDPTTTGDGDGDPTTTGDGDGDGDPTTTGDGDGDPTTTGDGDGDPATGDGDGDGSGDTFGDDTGTADESDTGDPPSVGGEGCNCSAGDADDDRGLLGSVLALGLLGLARRRRHRRMAR